MADLLLLLVAPQSYTQKREIFDEIRKQTGSWEEAQERTERHDLLRAVLVQLCR